MFLFKVLIRNIFLPSCICAATQLNIYITAQTSFFQRGQTFCKLSTNRRTVSCGTLSTLWLFVCLDYFPASIFDLLLSLTLIRFTIGKGTSCRLLYVFSQLVKIINFECFHQGFDSCTLASFLSVFSFSKTEMLLFLL